MGQTDTVSRDHTTTSERWMEVGQSWDPSPHQAGAQAAAAACAHPDLKLLVVLASFSAYGQSFDELLSGVREKAGDTPLIGCSALREIGPAESPEPGVVVIGFGGAFDVTAGYTAGLGERPRQAGQELANSLLPLPDRPYRAVLMFTDALAENQQEMIRGAYGVLGATVPVVGGCAGDDVMLVTSRQMFGGKVLQDAAVAACLSSDVPIGLSVRHGWQRQGDAMTVTASSGNAVYSFDDQPALDVYLRRHSAPPGIENDPEAFAEFAITRPLAVARRGEVAVRHVTGADPGLRTLVCGAAVSRGAAVWLATGNAESTLSATNLACGEAVQALGGRSPLGLLLFDCVGRRAVLGDAGTTEERRLMRDHAAGAPIGGFYSFGEIARIRGADGIHNQTIVAMAVG